MRPDRPDLSPEELDVDIRAVRHLQPGLDVGQLCLHGALGQLLLFKQPVLVGYDAGLLRDVLSTPSLGPVPVVPDRDVCAVLGIAVVDRYGVLAPLAAWRRLRRLPRREGGGRGLSQEGRQLAIGFGT